MILDDEFMRKDRRRFTTPNRTGTTFLDHLDIIIECFLKSTHKICASLFLFWLFSLFRSVICYASFFKFIRFSSVGREEETKNQKIVYNETILILDNYFSTFFRRNDAFVKWIFKSKAD